MTYVVSVFYNDEKDEHGRHVAWMDGYQKDHHVSFVASFEVEAEDTHHAAEVAWRQMNRVDGTEYISTKNLEVRSMCVGDVVVVSEAGGSEPTWMAAASFGFDDIEAPEKMQVPIKKVEV